MPKLQLAAQSATYLFHRIMKNLWAAHSMTCHGPGYAGKDKVLMQRHGTDALWKHVQSLRVLHRVGGITLELVAALHGRALLQLHCLTLRRSMLLIWCPTSACTLGEPSHQAESRA